MVNYSEISDDYLDQLVYFLHSIKWIYTSLNTKYIEADVIIENKKFIEKLNLIDLNDFPTLSSPQNNHPENLRKFIENVNRFRISFDTINTDCWKSTPVKKISVKKQYEIENVSKVIDEICKGKVAQLIDFGSGLGYLDLYLHDKYGYTILGLEGCDDRVEKAIKRQVEFHPKANGHVTYRQHFITEDSSEFILKQVGCDDKSPLAIFGLHGCGDLTVTAIKLFLKIDRVKNLIFMPCCYHKMTPTVPSGNNFNFFPLSQELASTLSNYSSFLDRPFLRLAGQQSPAKWKEMSESEHWIHGKNMFERAMVEALVEDDHESMKRINNISFLENRVTMDDIVLKYKLLDKSSGTSKEWTESHHRRFKELREKYRDGEEMSEKLFCLQTTIQSTCENLVLMDRIRFIEEEAKRKNLNFKISVKKLQNDKLSPRCLILIVEKL